MFGCFSQITILGILTRKLSPIIYLIIVGNCPSNVLSYIMADNLAIIIFNEWIDMSLYNSSDDEDGEILLAVSIVFYDNQQC
jgi:hypothetical protein